MTDTKAIVIEMLDGTHRCHEIDSDPDVERWAIAFVDTDGAAWVYNAHRFTAFVVTKFVEGEATGREEVDDTEPPEPRQADVDSTSPSTPDRAVGGAAVCVAADDDEDVVPSPPTARTRLGPRGRYDYAEVAAFVRECASNGWGVLASLSERYDATPGMAKHLLKHARRFDPTLPALKRGGPAGRPARPAGVKAAPLPTARTARPRVAEVEAVVQVPAARRAPAPVEAWSLTGPKPAPPARSFVELDDPLSAPQPPDTVGFTYGEVAAKYIEVEEECRMPIAAISEHFGVPRGWANAWVKTCRDMGLLPPRDQPQRERSAPAMRRAVPRVGY
jgi:hypothetical protein